jgi:hypothetical protein
MPDDNNHPDVHTYVFDMRDKLNRFLLERAKPGQEIRVLVRPEEDDKAKPIMAKGTLSTDGESFSLVVTTRDGKRQTHIVDYKALLGSIVASYLA